MSISRWKVMACTLGLSVGGLAIVAGPLNNRLNAQWSTPGKPTPQTTFPAPPVEPNSSRPGTAAGVQETIAPVGYHEIEIVMPQAVPPIPTAPVVPLEPIPEPSVRLYGPETLPMPRPATERVEFPTENLAVPPIPVPAVPFEAPPAFPVETIPQPAPAVEKLLPMAIQIEAPPIESQPVAPPVISQPMSLPVQQVVPTLTQVCPACPQAPPVCQAVPSPVAQPIAPTSVPALSATSPAYGFPAPSRQPVQQASATTAKLKMLLRLGDGKPRFEIRSSDSTDLLFKVYGEKVEMPTAPTGMKMSPIAGVTATGNVRFVGPGVEGTCDQLSVLSGTGEVLLKGNVSLKTKRGKTWSEMTAEKMVYQIGANGLTTASGPGSIRPASYNTRD